MPYPNEKSTAPDGWLGFEARAKQIYADHGQPWDEEARVHFWRAAYDCDSMPILAAFEKRYQEIAAALPQPPQPPDPPQPPASALVPPLEGYGRPHWPCLGGDKGPRHMLFYTYLCAVRDYIRDRPRFEANLAAMRGNAIGARIAFFLVGVPWDGVSRPDLNTRDLTVDVRQPGFDSDFKGCLQRFWDNGLRVHLTSGAIDQMPDPEGTYRRIARLCLEVNQQVCTGFAVLNEPWMTNTQDPQGAENWPRWRRYLDIFKAEHPWGLLGTAAPGSQEVAAGLIESARHPAVLALLQGTRTPPVDAIRRAFNVSYRDRPQVGKPIWAEEEAGPDVPYLPPAVYQPMQKWNDLLALYLMKLITGQGVDYLNGPGLWQDALLDATYGPREIMTKVRQIGIPEDIGTWTLADLRYAPITGEGGPDFRCDGAYNEQKGEAVYIAYGGTNVRPWLATRFGEQHEHAGWHARVQVWSDRPENDGLHLDREFAPGEPIFAEGGRQARHYIIKATRV